MNGILRVGELFLDKYRIERRVGSGGMGAVYAAVDIDLQRRVAIKVLLPEIARFSSAAARFVREGRTAARVESDHVARVFAAGHTPEGVPYMILELLEGRDLAGELRQRGRLRIVEAVDILRQALNGVAEAHHHGIVHRDLKPANLFLHQRSNGSRVVKVLDFGISKASPAQGESHEGVLTMTQTMLGSPLYMSPEQLLDSRTVDHRTDIWALGIVLHEMLAGAPPFDSKSLPGIISAIINDEVLPLGELRPEVPASLQAILARCLHRDPAQRIGDALELSRLLAPFAVEVDDTLELAPGVAAPDPLVETERVSIELETRVWTPRPEPVARAQTAPMRAISQNTTPFALIPSPRNARPQDPSSSKMPIHSRLFFLVGVPSATVFLAIVILLYAFGTARAPAPRAASSIADSGSSPDAEATTPREAGQTTSK